MSAWKSWDGIYPGDRAFVALNSWAGTTLHPVTVRYFTPKRARVTWVGRSCLGKLYGGDYYVPLEALKPETVETLKQALVQARGTQG